MARGDFRVSILDPRRKADCRRVLGTSIVGICSPEPQRVDLPDEPDALVYFLDLDELTVEQIDRVIAHLAETYKVPVDEVRELVGEHGVPIRAQNTHLIIRNPQRWED